MQGKISFSSTSFSIPANSSYLVTAVLSRASPLDGNIHFGNQSVHVLVSQPPQEQGNMALIPPNPVAGKNLILLIPHENATGYIYIQHSSNAYLITMVNGVAIISLDKEDFGSAVITLYGSKTYVKTINIQAPPINSLFLSFPSAIKTDTNTTFSVYADGEPVKAILHFTGADTFTTGTNEQGRANLLFRRAGNYTVTASYLNKTVTEMLTVASKPLRISLPANIHVGRVIQITTEPNAKIIIQKGDTSWSYTANSQGVCAFTPPYSGEYKITAVTLDKEGSASFVVKSDTSVDVVGVDGVKPTTVSKGDVILIKTLDESNNIISDGTVDIYTDGILATTLNAGVNLWKVSDGKTFEIRYTPDNTFYLPSSVTLYGNEQVQVDYISLGIIGGVIGGAILLYWLFTKSNIKLPKLSSSGKYKDLF